MLQLFLVLLGSLFIGKIVQSTYESYIRSKKAQKLGAGSIPTARNGILGWKGIRQTLRTHYNHLGPTGLAPQFEQYGKTHIWPIGPTKLIVTQEPENFKAMLATQFKDFSVGVRHRALSPFLGDGIFTLDGSGWSHSRAMLRPQFSRQQVSRLDSLERHFQEFVKCIDMAQGDGQLFDVQPLFFALTIDTATEFLFGQSTEAMVALLGGKTLDSESLDFAQAFDRAQKLSSLRRNLQGLYFVIGNIAFRDEYASVNNRAKRFVEKLVTKAIAAKRQKADEKVEKDHEDDEDDDAYIFMHELIKETTNVATLRDQMLNILLAGRDTTASSMSWVIYCLSRDPERYAKLRSAVLASFGPSSDHMTFESLKNCTYLRHVLNEILRLYPVVPVNTRTATRDTTLPKGGGPQGDEPVFVEKGQTVLYSVYYTHRDPFYWGEDAHEFVPERWEGAAIGRGWEYLPFNGGPRICLGQQFALTEMGYLLARFVQEFETLEGNGKEGFPALNHSLTMSHGEGVWIKLRR